jgi:hypothetical protein
LKREGYKLKPTSCNYQEFIKHIESLNEFEFMLDFHMPTYLLVFPPKTQFYDHPLYQDGSLVLQGLSLLSKNLKSQRNLEKTTTFRKLNLQIMIFLKNKSKKSLNNTAGPAGPLSPFDF